MCKCTDNVINISIVGVGGAGNNVINRMRKTAIPVTKYISTNTDNKAINKSLADIKLQIGIKHTNGLGSGANPENGRLSAEENYLEIKNAIKGSDMIFIVAGMGGGTGTGAAPVVAEIARSLGILTVAVVTKPFSFEGKKRMDKAVAGIDKLKSIADSTIVIPNDNLKYISTSKTTLLNAFSFTDDVLVQTVKNITEVIQQNALINCDFADICSVIKNSGYMYTAIGSASGENRIADVILQIKENKLLETSISDATNVLFCINSNENTTLDEIDEISSAISLLVNDNASIIMGMNFEDNADDKIKVVLIATHKK